VGLAGLEQREVHTLSGGERQRLAIAALLTQEPRLYLLDEPLAHLDLNHQIAMLALVSRYATERQAGFVVVLHDVNLALRYCSRALLLFGDGRWQAGPAEETLTAATLSALYGHPLRELRDGAERHFIPS
jgi:iron complex transport system ATP-binding protein